MSSWNPLYVHLYILCMVTQDQVVPLFGMSLYIILFAQNHKVLWNPSFTQGYLTWSSSNFRYSSISIIKLIKSVINRVCATCQNNNHFEYPTILNAPWDEHSMMFFKSVSLGLLLYLAKPSTNIDKHTHGRTDGRMDGWTDRRTQPNVLSSLLRCR